MTSRFIPIAALASQSTKQALLTEVSIVVALQHLHLPGHCARLWLVGDWVWHRLTGQHCHLRRRLQQLLACSLQTLAWQELCKVRSCFRTVAHAECSYKGRCMQGMP